jgi:hypothetical protein
MTKINFKVFFYELQLFQVITIAFYVNKIGVKTLTFRFRFIFGITKPLMLTQLFISISD